jgi:hypothetical protein
MAYLHEKDTDTIAVPDTYNGRGTKLGTGLKPALIRAC